MRLHVHTQTGSVHEIDPDENTYSRLLRGPESGSLRRDGEVMHMVECMPIEVGQPVVMVLRLREDGVLTYRTTSPVVRVELA